MNAHAGSWAAKRPRNSISHTTICKSACFRKRASTRACNSQRFRHVDWRAGDSQGRDGRQSSTRTQLNGSTQPEVFGFIILDTSQPAAASAHHRYIGEAYIWTESLATGVQKVVAIDTRAMSRAHSGPWFVGEFSLPAIGKLVPSPGSGNALQDNCIQLGMGAGRAMSCRHSAKIAACGLWVVRPPCRRFPRCRQPGRGVW